MFVVIALNSEARTEAGPAALRAFATPIIVHFGAVLLILAYGSLVVAGILLGHRPEAALDVVAGAALLLLYIGIHNAWDSAVWLTTKPKESRGAAPGSDSTK